VCKAGFAGEERLRIESAVDGHGRRPQSRQSQLVLLINPAPLRTSSTDQNIRERYPYPPLGLLALAGQALMHGYAVEIIDFFRASFPSRASFRARLEQLPRAPVLVGITTYTETAAAVTKIAAAVGEVWPSTCLVVGGPHATFCAEEILAEAPEVRVVVRNEGEGALVELLEHCHDADALPLRNITGITFRAQDGTIVHTPERPAVRHLDCLPFPPFWLLPPPRTITGESVLVFLTSRGCPGRCVFCASRAMAGGAYRMHSAEYLAALVWNEFTHANFDGMGIMDDTFLVDFRRLEKFCQYLDELAIRVPWTCKSRVDTLHPGMLEILRRAGCKSIHIGVESADDAVLSGIGKRVKIARVLNGITALCAHGIRPECSFIIGHHCDTLATIEKTLLLARAIQENDIGVSVVGICTPLPGTVLQRRAAELGVRFVTTDWEHYDLNTPVFETDRFSVADLRRAQYYMEAGAAAGEPLPFGGFDHSEFRAQLDDFIARVKEVKRTGDRHAAQ